MTITVGLPFFNDERYLENAIRSIFAQSIDNWKLLLVDDGSSDSSLDIAMSVKDERVRVIQGKENRGLPYRLNQITSLTKSKYLARMDGDDMMHPERLKKQMQALRCNPNTPCISTGVWIIDDVNNARGYRAFCSTNQSLDTQKVLANRVMVHPTLTASTDWFRRNLYSEDHRRVQDHELWCRAFLKGDLKLICIDEPLYLFREIGSCTLKKAIVGHMTYCRILRKHGRNLAGSFRTNLQVAKSYTKIAIYTIAFGIGVHNRIINMRQNQNIRTEEEQEASEIVKRIQSTPVPGFPKIV